MYFLGSWYVNIHRYLYESLYFSSPLDVDCISIFASRRNSVNLYVDFNVLAIMAEAFDFYCLLCGINVSIFLPNYTESYLIKQYTV